jgi:hypothetical protein
MLLWLLLFSKVIHRSYKVMGKRPQLLWYPAPWPTLCAAAAAVEPSVIAVGAWMCAVLLLLLQLVLC